MSQNFMLNQIAPTMVAFGDSGTLAELYANLTSDSASNAWGNFQNAIQALPNGVTSDDPFNASQATQIATSTPATLPGKTLKPNAPRFVVKPKIRNASASPTRKDGIKKTA